MKISQKTLQTDISSYPDDFASIASIIKNSIPSSSNRGGAIGFSELGLLIFSPVEEDMSNKRADNLIKNLLDPYRDLPTIFVQHPEYDFLQAMVNAFQLPEKEKECPGITALFCNKFNEKLAQERPELEKRAVRSLDIKEKQQEKYSGFPRNLEEFKQATKRNNFALAVQIINNENAQNVDSKTYVRSSDESEEAFFCRQMTLEELEKRISGITEYMLELRSKELNKIRGEQTLKLANSFLLPSSRTKQQPDTEKIVEKPLDVKEKEPEKEIEFPTNLSNFRKAAKENNFAKALKIIEHENAKNVNFEVSVRGADETDESFFCRQMNLEELEERIPGITEYMLELRSKEQNKIRGEQTLKLANSFIFSSSFRKKEPINLIKEDKKPSNIQEGQQVKDSWFPETLEEFKKLTRRSNFTLAVQKINNYNANSVDFKTCTRNIN